jgi:hypothetical protein
VTITPDNKDWTWVLERRCPECGFEAASIERSELAAIVRSSSKSWLEVLARDDVEVRETPDRWSPLEYGCHVRDVFSIFDRRVSLMLVEDDPTFPNWDQDATAAEEDYPSQDPRQVGRQLSEAAAALAGRFDRTSGVAWGRTGNRSNGSTFTVESIGRYMAHDVVHHLWDVGYQ